jgi:hypothetical protein|eukprot:COSAG06_NODE_3395_length_5406_cov_3.434520_3_plen_66_part_00
MVGPSDFIERFPDAGGSALQLTPRCRDLAQHLDTNRQTRTRARATRVRYWLAIDLPGHLRLLLSS